MKLQVTPYMAIELTEPNELINLINEDDRVHFMQSLSCHDEVFKHVADQIINSMTVDGYSASQTIVKPNPTTALQSAVRQVAHMSSDVASKEIERLERELQRVSKLCDEFQDKYYDLYHKQGGRL